MYAPPEVVAAFAAQRRVRAEPSHDVWALGVMVFEALTGRSAIDRYSDQEDVIAFAEGRERYPWEEMAATGDADVAMGGAFAGLCNEDMRTINAGSARDARSASSEGGAGDTPQVEARRARAFLRRRTRPALEACLRRDPAARPAASELLRMIDSLGSATRASS
jgi:serine/threonine protein kinase